MEELAGDRRGASSPTLPFSLPDLPDDLLVEILLRLPPEPIHLFRASFVSKRWRHLVHDARFLRRFRELHGGRPPLLGFFNDHPGSPLFVPTTGSFGVSAAMRRQEDWWALDCRHGRALLGSKRTGELLVWDLMTGEKQYLGLPPACDENWDYNLAVLCAAGHPHHGDCRSCPFLVAVVSSHQTDFIASARVYSSNTSVWGEVTSIAIPHSLVANKPTALVGNTLYWLSDNSGIIIELDLDKHSLGLIEDVPEDALYNYDGQIIIMPLEDGLLGFAGVDDGLSLHLWARVANIDGVVTWTLRRVIDLEIFLAPEVVLGCIYRVEPIGFAEDADVIFVNVHPSTYMINLKSMQIEVVLEKGNYWSILPYTSFYATDIWQSVHISVAVSDQLFPCPQLPLASGTHSSHRSHTWWWR